MRADALLTASIEVETAIDEKVYIRAKRRWQFRLFVIGLATTITASIGLLLSAASLLNMITKSGRLSLAGSVLLAISFPLLFLTAHCLDRIDEAKSAIRMASYRKTLLERIKH
jgi:hypothetical protein